MMELYTQWKIMASRLRLAAEECDDPEAAMKMLARADALENCATELMTAYLSARD